MTSSQLQSRDVSEREVRQLAARLGYGLTIKPDGAIVLRPPRRPDE